MAGGVFLVWWWGVFGVGLFFGGVFFFSFFFSFP